MVFINQGETEPKMSPKANLISDSSIPSSALDRTKKYIASNLIEVTWFRSVSGEEEIGQDGQEDEEEDEDFSFLDETDYVIYEDCWGDGEDEECDKAYKFGGDGTNDYYDYQETLKDFDKTTKKKKKKKDDSPTQDEKSFKDDNGKL